MNRTAIVCKTSSLTIPRGSSRSGLRRSPDGRIFVCEQIGNLRIIENGFARYTPFVDVVSSQMGAGTVQVSPPGTDCSNTAGSSNACDYFYPPDTVVTLTATASADSEFLGWGGECVGTETCTVTLTNRYDNVMSAFRRVALSPTPTPTPHSDRDPRPDSDEHADDNRDGHAHGHRDGHRTSNRDFAQQREDQLWRRGGQPIRGRYRVRRWHRRHQLDGRHRCEHRDRPRASGGLSYGALRGVDLHDPGLYPRILAHVRLHFCENFFTAGGKRKLNASINGAAVLTNFDIFSTAGATHKAIIRQFTATANNSGQFAIQLTNVTSNALINGIEVF